MNLFSKFKLSALVTVLVVSSNAFSYQIDCSPEVGRINRGKDNLRQLTFHNGGGSWTGFFSPYLTFKFGSNGRLYDFDYREDKVDLREISEGHYQAQIKVSKLYKDEVIVNCDIRE